MTQPTLKIKRVYLPAEESDGYRILIDRLWPRGMNKTQAHIDRWEKTLAPSTTLRQWFGHRPERFAEFSRRYESELRTNPAFDALLQDLCQQSTVTLLYAAKDEQHNNAAVLQQVLQKAIAT